MRRTMHPLERLVNLVALLLDARRRSPSIRSRRLAGPTPRRTLASAKRMFERDKGILRDIGVPIEVVAVDAWEVEQGTRSPRTVLPAGDRLHARGDLGAVRGGPLGRSDSSAEEAVRKLLWTGRGRILVGVSGSPLATDGGPTSGSPRRPRRSRASGASGSGYRTSRGERCERVSTPTAWPSGRQLVPGGLDRERAETRSFRLSGSRPTSSTSGRGAPPEGFRAADHVQVGPWGPGEPRERATVAFSPEAAWWATRACGRRGRATRDDGWVEVAVPTGPGRGWRRGSCRSGRTPVALEPPDLRPRSSGAWRSRSCPRDRSAQAPKASERLRRLLVVVPTWFGTPGRRWRR